MPQTHLRTIRLNLTCDMYSGVHSKIAADMVLHYENSGHTHPDMYFVSVDLRLTLGVVVLEEVLYWKTEDRHLLGRVLVEGVVVGEMTWLLVFHSVELQVVLLAQEVAEVKVGHSR